MIYYKNLDTDIKILTYDQLDNELIKDIARKEVIEVDLGYYKKELNEYKELVKTNINSIINSNSKKKKLNRFIEKKNFILKLSNDIKYCEKYILDNFCNFTNNGIYITYMIKNL